MPRHVVVLVLICLSVAQPASAGAWLRDTGRGFLSFTATQRSIEGAWETEMAIYGDYGISPGLTLGIDVNSRPEIAGHAVVFARLPLRPTGGEGRLALELGAGIHQLRGHWSRMGKVTLSFGREYGGRWGQGWVSLDAAVETRSGVPGPIFKLDATAGLSSGWRLRPIVQIETFFIDGTSRGWAITPGVTFDIGKDKTWLIGIERKSIVQDSVGLKFGLWRRF